MIKITDKFSITPGFRFDHIAATDSTPPVIEDGYYAYYTYYPLATPIYIPRGRSSPIYVDENGNNHSTYMGYDVSGTREDESYFLSLSYKLTDASSIYATYDRADAILGTSNFGGLDVSAVSSYTFAQQLQKSLSALSTLYELGYKQSFLNNTFYFGSALFQQTKLGVQIGGAMVKIKDEGVELDAVYQPSKQWAINANFTYQDATIYGNYFFQETGNYLDSYNPDYTVNGLPGTGYGEPNFTGYVPPNGKMRAPGIPQLQANLFLVYKNPRGWGGGIGPQIQGKQYANDQETLSIPLEEEWDGYIFYGQRTWDVRLNIKNLLNQRILDPIDVSFAGNDTIYVRPPISASVTIRYHF